MLKGNLATRPFYNERLVGLVLAGLALVALGLAAFNAQQILALTARHSALKAEIAKDDAEAARIRGEAQALQASVKSATLNALAGSTREANGLIDQRTFSWTAFFSIIEKTLPYGVRLIAVAPKAQKGEFRVAMTVVAKAGVDLDQFVEALNGTGHFFDVLATAQELNDDGSYTAAMEAGYLPPAIDGKAGAAGAAEAAR